MTTRTPSKTVKVLPYVIVVLSLVFLPYVIDFFKDIVAKDWFHTPHFGPWLAWIMIIVGGYAIGLWSLHTTQVGEEFDDKLSKCCYSFQEQWPRYGFFVNTFFMGSMGASRALKQLGYPDLLLYSFISAVLFASAWVPLCIALFG